jgi:hypothetical protein
MIDTACLALGHSTAASATTKRSASSPAAQRSNSRNAVLLPQLFGPPRTIAREPGTRSGSLPGLLPAEADLGQFQRLSHTPSMSAGSRGVKCVRAPSR